MYVGCSDSLWWPEDLTVEVGRHTSSWMEVERPKLVQLIAINRFVVHEGYDGFTFENDIALLELNESISYSEHVQPICLSHEDPRTRAPLRYRRLGRHSRYESYDRSWTLAPHTRTLR